MRRQEYDYVIIGGGSAGCTLAARLTEDPNVSVLLVEAGRARGNIFNSWMIEMPAGFEKTWRSDTFAWQYMGEEEPTLHNRRIGQPRGKVLGGSSQINGMVYIRGHAQDFERWVREGCDGWSWREVLPYFKRMESWEGGETLYRGGSGPIKVIQGQMKSPLYQAFLSAGSTAGFPLSDDLNANEQEGFGALQMNVRNGVRSSAAEAYLRPNQTRRNLTVLDRATAQNLIIEGNRVAGANFLRAGQAIQAYAARETILTAGTTNSPQLLMLSGIGPSEHLKEHGIACRVDLPGVGQNLQDHPILYLKYQVDKPVSIYKYMRPDRMALAGAQWMATHTGPGASNHVETGALFRSDSSQAYPDMEIQYVPAVAGHDEGVLNIHGFTITINPCRIESRGWVKLRSARPSDPPRMMSNFLATGHDLHQQRMAVQWSHELAAQPSYRELGAKSLDPGSLGSDKAALDHFLRANTHGDFHLVGTCKMGKDRMAVVDSKFRVHGIEGLRVVDASVMPSIISTNTNCTTIMIAERAADMIRGHELLPPAVLP